jgi:PilZ domain-containing protein
MRLTFRESIMETSATKFVERRAQLRFPVHVQLEYRLIKSGPLRVSGKACSIDISSKGIAFTTEAVLNPGALIELVLDWPCGADDTSRLVLMGHIVRLSGKIVACAISRFEFGSRQTDFQRYSPAPTLRAPAGNPSDRQ